MESIKDYIMNGKGYGIKFLAVLSLVMAVIFANDIKNAGEFLIPHLQAAADSVFPIKIENGTVTEPENTIKSYSFQFGGDNGFQVVIDTTVDTLDINNLPFGIYLSRKNLYVVSPGKVTTYPLEGNSYFPVGDYSDIMRSMVVWTAIISSVIMIFVYFITYLFLAWVFAWLARLVSIAFNRKIDRDVEMRLSVCCIIAMEILFWILGLFGFSSFWLFATAVLLLEIVVFKNLSDSYDLPLRQRPKVEKI